MAVPTLQSTIHRFLGRVTFEDDSAFYTLLFGDTDPAFNFDTWDFMYYDRSENELVFYIGEGVEAVKIGACYVSLKETTTPGADAGYGKIYTKNDDKLYFQDGSGVEHEIDFV